MGDNNSEAWICLCALMCALLCAPFILVPIGFITIDKHNEVVNLPQGIAFANLGVLESNIGSVTSSSKIIGVPVLVNNVTIGDDFIIRFPPPPTVLNLKGKTEVRQWEASTVGAQNGIVVFFDAESRTAWTDPVGQGGAIAMVVLGIFIACVILCAVINGIRVNRRENEKHIQRSLAKHHTTHDIPIGTN